VAEQPAEDPGPDRRAIPVIGLGILLIFAPLFALPSAGDGPIAVVVGLMQAIAAAVGLVVAATGLYSHRTGDLRPAVAAAVTVVGLLGLGVVGAVVELSVGRLIPIWAWFLAAVLVILGAFGLTLQVVPAGSRSRPR
jgi:ABC-type amino acid transport system permease subunit